jgi:hypothetical protein
MKIGDNRCGLHAALAGSHVAPESMCGFYQSHRSVRRMISPGCKGGFSLYSMFAIPRRH